MAASASIARWQEEAEGIEKPRGLNIPFQVLLGECVEAAKFVREYYEPGHKRPGLVSAGPKLSSSIAEDILSLRDAAQDAQTEYHLIIDPKVDTVQLKERGNFIVDEITATLEWYLDDGVETEADQQLEQLEKTHADDGDSSDTLAQALHDYCTLASPLASQIDGLGEFDADLIPEGFDIATKLGDVSTTPQQQSKQAKQAKLLRDQLAHLLYEKVAMVCRAARFVFREHPDIAKIPTSTYARRRRAAAARAAKAAEAALNEAPESTTDSNEAASGE